jgi:hypothetical protein
MISEAQNKSMQSPDEPTTIRAVSQIKNEYHFPGSGVWKPLSIVASTIEEATNIWKAKRESVTKEEKTETKKPDNE